MFYDRRDAGKKLAELLEHYRGTSDTIVLGLPRGGVVVASKVAAVLVLPLDVIVTRKIGAPGNPEFAIGAIDAAGNRFLNQEVVTRFGISDEYLDRAIAAEQQEAARRLALYRKDRLPLDLKGREVILADDGIATGATMRAAIASCRAGGASRVVVAAPVAPPEVVSSLKREADEVLVIDQPESFGSVGAFYIEFGQTTDAEVVACLHST